MSHGLAVHLDCIIFGPQRFGGISNHWAELVEHACVTPAVQWSLTQPKTLKFLAFDERWHTRLAATHEQIPTPKTRHLSAPVSAQADVFRTSYHRLPRRSVARFMVAANSSSLPVVGGQAALYAAEQHTDGYAQLLPAVHEPARRSLLIEADLQRVRDFPWSSLMKQIMSTYVNMFYVLGLSVLTTRHGLRRRLSTVPTAPDRSLTLRAHDGVTPR
jgi:hypothetical protein